jgi:hypothetical protein
MGDVDCFGQGRRLQIITGPHGIHDLDVPKSSPGPSLRHAIKVTGGQTINSPDLHFGLRIASRPETHNVILILASAMD